MLAWTEWQEELPGKDGIKGPMGDSGLADIVSLALPGMIIMWFGALEDLPATWAVCDGTNGTPDLSSLFVYAYSTNPYRQLSLHSTGGSKDSIVPTHLHNISDSGHSHTFETKPAIWDWHVIMDYNPELDNRFYGGWSETGYAYPRFPTWPPGYDATRWTQTTFDRIANPIESTVLESYLGGVIPPPGYIPAATWCNPAIPYVSIKPPVLPEPNYSYWPPHNPLSPLQTYTGIVLNDTGVDGADANMPPHMVLYYIMFIG